MEQRLLYELEGLRLRVKVDDSDMEAVGLLLNDGLPMCMVDPYGRALLKS